MTVRCPSNSRRASSTSGLLAPAAQSSAGRAACSCLPWPVVLSRRPHRPLLLPPLARPSLHSPTPPVILRRRQRSRTSEPSYSSPRVHPLSRLPGLRVVPFLGLAIVHRRGALGTAWSMWSRNDFHQTWTVRGEDDSRDPPASWQYASKCLYSTSPKIWFLLMVGHLGLTPLSS